jgi:hypothetical protein
MVLAAALDQKGLSQKLLLHPHPSGLIPKHKLSLHHPLAFITSHGCIPLTKLEFLDNLSD